MSAANRIQSNEDVMSNWNFIQSAKSDLKSTVQISVVESEYAMYAAFSCASKIGGIQNEMGAIEAKTHVTYTKLSYEKQLGVYA